MPHDAEKMIFILKGKVSSYLISLKAYYTELFVFEKRKLLTMIKILRICSY